MYPTTMGEIAQMRDILENQWVVNNEHVHFSGHV